MPIFHLPSGLTVIYQPRAEAWDAFAALYTAGSWVEGRFCRTGPASGFAVLGRAEGSIAASVTRDSATAFLRVLRARGPDGPLPENVPASFKVESIEADMFRLSLRVSVPGKPASGLHSTSPWFSWDANSEEVQSELQQLTQTYTSPMAEPASGLLPAAATAIEELAARLTSRRGERDQQESFTGEEAEAAASAVNAGIAEIFLRIGPPPSSTSADAGDPTGPGGASSGGHHAPVGAGRGRRGR